MFALGRSCTHERFTHGSRFKWGAGIFESRYIIFDQAISRNIVKGLQGWVTFKYVGSLQMKTRVLMIVNNPENEYGTAQNILM